MSKSYSSTTEYVWLKFSASLSTIHKMMSDIGENTSDSLQLGILAGYKMKRLAWMLEGLAVTPTGLFYIRLKHD